MVVTEPTVWSRTATGLRLSVRIRSPTNTTASRRSAAPVRTSRRRSSMPSSCERPPDALGGQLQHQVRLVVDQRDPLVEVEADHALLDPREHGLAVLDEPADLHRLQPEGLPLDPARDEQRPREPDDARQPQVGEQVRHRGQQALAEARVGLPDRDHAHHLPGLRAGLAEHRHLRDHRGPPGPSPSPTDDRVARSSRVPSRAGSRVLATTTPSASAISTNDTPGEALHAVGDGRGLVGARGPRRATPAPAAAPGGPPGSPLPTTRGRPPCVGSRSGPGPATPRRRRRARPR